MNSSCGRPSFISAESKLELSSFLRTGKYSKRTSEYRAKLTEIVTKEAASSGQSNSQVKFPSRSTINNRLEAELSIHTSNAENTTDARAVAVADVRNAVSFAAMNQLMSPLVNPHLILNADATQFTVGDTGADNQQVKYCGKRGTQPLKVQPIKQNNGIVKYSIKYLLLISAAGYQADPVYILADDNMGLNDLDVQRVAGLGIGTDIGNSGYVVFCKTRCCNIAFYDWFNRYILLPFIEKIKENFGIDEAAPAWFQLDGEPEQIAIYSKPAILKLFKENNVLIGKQCASSTEIEQPCDIGNCFKGSKTKLLSIDDTYVKGNTIMMERNKKIIEKHNEYL